jgi:hypothetical protein
LLLVVRWSVSSLLVITLSLGSALALAQGAAEPTPPKDELPPAESEKDEGAKDEPKEQPKEERKPHPEPRVIIDVATKKKTKTSEAIQAAARSGFWGKTVGCYKKVAWEDPKLEVDVTLRVDVRGGAIKKATVQKAPAPKKKTKKKKAKSKTDEVAACLAKRAVGLSMPKGIRTATSLRVQVYPGDDPIPPPAPKK